MASYDPSEKCIDLEKLPTTVRWPTLEETDLPLQICRPTWRLLGRPLRQSLCAFKYWSKSLSGSTPSFLKPSSISCEQKYAKVGSSICMFVNPSSWRVLNSL